MVSALLAEFQQLPITHMPVSFIFRLGQALRPWASRIQTLCKFFLRWEEHLRSRGSKMGNSLGLWVCGRKGVHKRGEGRRCHGAGGNLNKTKDLNRGESFVWR